MAGFFGLFDYTRPGPGVPKDAPPKSPFIVFFEILQRKFWNLIKINIMFLVFNLPALVLGMLAMLMFIPNLFEQTTANSNVVDPNAIMNDLLLKFVILTIFMCIPMITVGPAQAGFTYIMRNYAREEHAFIWGDFKDTALKNFKQSLAVSSINFFVTFMILFSIRAYSELIRHNLIPVMLGTAGFAIMVLVFIIFACMNMYIYQILITFELTLKQIYKNSLIFAIIKFIPNIGILLLSAFIIFLSFGMIIPFNPLIGFFPYFFITVSLIGFLTNFYAYPKIKKYMLSRIKNEDGEDDSEVEDKDEENSDDEGNIDDDNESDNGGMDKDSLKRADEESDAQPESEA